MTLQRREVVKTLLAERGGLLVVAGLGSTAWDCTAAGDHDLTFPLWGAMGCAACRLDRSVPTRRPCSSAWC